MGLAISRRLAELMGGRMWVESELGVGSRFQFTLQVLAAHEQPGDAEIGVRLEGRRMLIVDDNATNRRVALPPGQVVGNGLRSHRDRPRRRCNGCAPGAGSMSRSSTCRCRSWTGSSSAREIRQLHDSRRHATRDAHFARAPRGGGRQRSASQHSCTSRVSPPRSTTRWSAFSMDTLNPSPSGPTPAWTRQWPHDTRCASSSPKTTP